MKSALGEVWKIKWREEPDGRERDRLSNSAILIQRFCVVGRGRTNRQPVHNKWVPSVG